MGKWTSTAEWFGSAFVTMLAAALILHAQNGGSNTESFAWIAAIILGIVSLVCVIGGISTTIITNRRRIIFTDESISGNLISGDSPMWRLGVENKGQGAFFRVMVEQLAGTRMMEDSFQLPWRNGAEVLPLATNEKGIVNVARLADDYNALLALAGLPVEFFSVSAGQFRRALHKNWALLHVAVYNDSHQRRARKVFMLSQDPETSAFKFRENRPDSFVTRLKIKLGCRLLGQVPS